MSWYLTICSDSSYSRSTDTGTLVEYLNTLPEVIQTGPQEYRNAPDMPWVVINMAKVNENGGYAIDGTVPETINVVELICADGNDKWYESLANRIAQFLGWKTLNDHEG